MLFLVFGALGQASDTDRDPCFTGRENYVRISDWLLTSKRSEHVWRAEWLAKERNLQTLQVEIAARQEDRKHGKSLCMHSIVTKASTGNRRRIHNSALSSVSGPQGLEYSFLPFLFIVHSLVWPFFLIENSGLVVHHWSLLSFPCSDKHCQTLWTPASHWPGISHQVIQTHACRQAHAALTHTFWNTCTPSTCAFYHQLVWRSQQPLVVDEWNHSVPLLLQSKPSPTAVGTL